MILGVRLVPPEGHYGIQRPLHNEIDHADVAAGALPEKRIGLWADREFRSGVGEFELHVALGFLGRKGVQDKIDADSAAELSEIRLVDELLEFRLAHEEYLDEFLSVVLQIGEHAQCFKGLGAEVVGLVDDDGGVVSLVETIDEKGVELLQHVGQGHVLSHGQFEILGNGQEKILAIQYGIENPGGGDLFLFQHGQQLVQRRCLADTDFALQNQESFSACYTVTRLSGFILLFKIQQTC
jgi:hypothetical protein